MFNKAHTHARARALHTQATHSLTVHMSAPHDTHTFAHMPHTYGLARHDLVAHANYNVDQQMTIRFFLSRTFIQMATHTANFAALLKC